jgi:hypothetical protein
MYAVCTLNNSNPACTANFTAASISIGSERNSINMSIPHGAWKTEYVVNLNVSKEDNGKDVTCAAECAEFQDLDLRDTKKIKLPCKLIPTSQYKLKLIGRHLYRFVIKMIICILRYKIIEFWKQSDPSEALITTK